MKIVESQNSGKLNECAEYIENIEAHNLTPQKQLSHCAPISLNTEMEKFGDESFINLDYDRDMNNSYSDRGNDSSDESHSQDNNDVGNQNEAMDDDLTYEQYKSIIDLTANDIRGMEFGSEEHACNFYDSYGRCHGFVARKDDIKHDAEGNIIVRQLVCNKEGLRNKKHFIRLDRKRPHRPITRTICQAKLRVHFDYKRSKWTVLSFIETHNHYLCPPKYRHLIPAHRKMGDTDKAQADNFHSYGVRTCHIMGYMLAQKGGYSALGLTKKDMYNYFSEKNREKIKDGDACIALSYLQGKADNNGLMHSPYSFTSDGKLKNLFWADEVSRSDFQCFGDVLAFDTTYKKNKYNRPLVIFSGCNHHSQTVIFGCALVSDETIDTYKWLLESFLDAMWNKHPKSVVTDGDGAMREAIKKVFPNATHRLCAWHLHKNACENVKNSSFLGDFKTAMYTNFTPEKFKNFWQQMVLKHGLVENKWVSKTYENKYMWASVYLRDKFFGRIRTTSQCEAINSLVKSYANNKCSIIDFMHKFEQVVREYRNNELMADFKCFWSEPVLTTSLYKIERDASKIFTQEIFKDVKSEIEVAGALNVIERVINGEKLILKMNKYCDIGREFVVDYDTVNCNFFCECKLFESRGIPCTHIICAMKNEHIDSIPSSLICKRWTKTAKSDIISASRLDDLDSDVMSGARVGAAAAACNRLCSIAREKNACFNDILNDIFKLLNKYENQGDPNNMVRSSFKDVGDPCLVKIKGAPSKKKYERKRRCSNCSRRGHIARKCPRLLSTDDQVPMDGDSSHSDGDDFTIGEENDKEGNLVDQCDDQQIGSKNQSRMRKDNNVKGKGTGSFKMKEKTVNRSAHNSVKQPKIEPIGSSSDANADNPQHQNLNPGYATTSQGVNISPHHGGGTL